MITKEEIIQQSNRIINESKNNLFGSFAQAKEFLRTYAGKESSFLSILEDVNLTRADQGFALKLLEQTLTSFNNYVTNGLLRAISLEREIQIETVSDYLEQARALLNKKDIHPAAPAMIIGASLEEFLRNWVEEVIVNTREVDNTIDGYAKALRSGNLIEKQDSKDITSWGGLRNDAAHGRWEKVNDKSRIEIMLAGVNLFIRKYSTN